MIVSEQRTDGYFKIYSSEGKKIVDKRTQKVYSEAILKEDNKSNFEEE